MKKKQCQMLKDKVNVFLNKKDFIKDEIIQSFSVLFDAITEKEKIISFVEKQLNRGSSKTRKTAKAF